MRKDINTLLKKKNPTASLWDLLGGGQVPLLLSILVCLMGRREVSLKDLTEGFKTPVTHFGHEGTTKVS